MNGILRPYRGLVLLVLLLASGASFVIPPGYAQSSPPAPCAPTVTGPEVGSQVGGWKKK